MNFSDPILWMCVGVIVFGFVFMIWAIGRFRNKKSDSHDDLLDALSSSPEDSPITSIDIQSPIREKPAFEKPMRRSEPTFPTTPSAAAIPSSVLTSAFSKEVSDRLLSMTHQLSDMQTVLNKQPAPAGGGTAPAPGSIGQGLSPETIDKLLKIIGSVIQQVDVLQKSLNLSKEPGPSPMSGAAPSGSVFTAPPSSTTPKISSIPKS